MTSQIEIGDAQALIGTCQAISAEIALDRVIERFITSAVDYAGAKRGVFLLCDAGLRIVAEAVTRDGSVQLVERPFGALDMELSDGALQWVRRAFRPQLPGDPSDAQSPDAFLQTGESQSVLCIPLLKREPWVGARLKRDGWVGALYLENDLASPISTNRLLMLQMLASQASISMENAEHLHAVQQARDHARQFGEELRRYFDNLPVMAWQNSADGALEFANKRWHDYTGSSPDDDPLEVWSFFHPDDREHVVERWRYLLEFRVPGEIEARMRRVDGEYRRFLVRAGPLLDENGAIVKWHGINTDIEDIKRAEEAQSALARVSRITAMGELTVSIAHEVNQPLMAIVTNAASCMRWLASETVNVPEARLAAERIVRDGHRAGEVLASIRAMARKGPIQFVEVDFNEVVAEVLVLARNELQRHGIAVETQLSPETSKALGDRVQIQQVVLNLILNGIEAMTAVDHAPRLLLVRTENVDGGFVQASVSDSGPGLEPNDFDRIFDAFFTTKTHGLGMGLSICRSIVENHGGRMAVADNLPQGCIFSFQLPTLREERSIAPLQ